jgi:hypothetical protein
MSNNPARYFSVPGQDKQQKADASRLFYSRLIPFLLHE